MSENYPLDIQYMFVRRVGDWYCVSLSVLFSNAFFFFFSFFFPPQPYDMWSEIFDGTIGVIGNGGPRLQLQCVDSVDICRFVALVTGR